MMSQCMDKGRVCSRQDDPGLDRQSSQGDTCHTGGPLCCVGSSVMEEDMQFILFYRP